MKCAVPTAWIPPRFLIVTNMMLYDEIPADTYDKVSMEGLPLLPAQLARLLFGFRLPAIREKLAAAVGTGSDLSRAIMKYFDDYTAGVHTPWPTKRRWCSPYVRALLEAPPAGLQHRHLQPGTTTRWRRCSRSSRTY